MRLARFSLRCPTLRHLVCCAVTAVPIAAAAQLKAPGDAAADYPTPARFASAPHGDDVAPRADGHALPAGSADRPAAPALRASRWSSARLIEMPRDTKPGQYSRPHYALGFRSEAMRGWLKEAGLDADTCIAPVLRLRTKLSDGALSGALWVYARCSFR